MISTGISSRPNSGDKIWTTISSSFRKLNIHISQTIITCSYIRCSWNCITLHRDITWYIRKHRSNCIFDCNHLFHRICIPTIICCYPSSSNCIRTTISNYFCKNNSYIRITCITYCYIRYCWNRSTFYCYIVWYICKHWSNRIFNCNQLCNNICISTIICSSPCPSEGIRISTSTRSIRFI